MSWRKNGFENKPIYIYTNITEDPFIVAQRTFCTKNIEFVKHNYNIGH